MSGTGAQRLFKSSPGQDATFLHEMETYWADYILFRSCFQEKSPQDFFLWEWGVWAFTARNSLGTWALPPTAAQPAVCRKRRLSLFRPGLTWSPIIHSGPSFGSGFSKCPHFLVTQMLVAVCFLSYTLQSSDHELLADPTLGPLPCCPVNSHLDHCTGSGVRAPLPFSKPHSAAQLSVFKALVRLFVHGPNGLPAVSCSRNQVGTLRPQTL